MHDFVPTEKHPGRRYPRKMDARMAYRIADGKKKCPMKEGLRCAATVPILIECNCSGCVFWQKIFENPHDGFLSSIITKKKDQRSDAPLLTVNHREGAKA